MIVSVLPSCSSNMVSYTDEQGEPDVHTMAQFICGPAGVCHVGGCKAPGVWDKNH